MARPARSGGARLPPDPSTTDLRPDIAADPDADPESAARGICLRLLAIRAHTRVELGEALARKGIADDVSARVLDRYSQVGLIDDAAFAAMFTQSRQAERGLSAREISRQLRSKGVDESIVRDTVAGIDSETERQTARVLVDRKLRSMTNLADEVKMRRLVGLLARKGYSAGLAFAVCKDAIRANGSAGLADELGFLIED
jgi:regulatory protein